MRRARKLTTVLATLGVLGGGLMFTAVPAVAGTGHVYSSQFGGPCTGPAGACEPDQLKEPLKEPEGVAVNDTTGDVYVVDKANNRVEYFNSTGTYLGELDATETPAKNFTGPEEIAVDNSCSLHSPVLTQSTTPKCSEFDLSNGDVYVTDPGQKLTDKFEANGKYVSQIHSPESKTGEDRGGPLGVGVDLNGAVWVATSGYNEAGGCGNGEGAEVNSYNDAVVNELVYSSIFIPVNGGFVASFAVDSEDNFYQIDNPAGGSNNRVSKTNPNELKYNETCHQVEGSETFMGASARVTGVSVDPSGNSVYLDEGTSIYEYEPDGLLVQKEAGAGHLAAGSGIGVNSATKTVYVADSTGDDVIILSPHPTASTPETLAATEVKARGALLHGKLIGSAGEKLKYYFEYQAGTNCKGGSTTPELEGKGEEEVSAEITRLEPSKEYAVCLIAENEYGTSTGPNIPLTTSPEPPEIVPGSLEASSVEAGANGVFSAEINPNNQEITSDYFEYSTEATGEILEGEIETSGGELFSPHVFGPQKISVGAHEPFWNRRTYYYRLVVENAAGEKTESKVQAYTKIPIVENESASKLTLTSASLEAKINPDWHNTSYEFEYASSKEELEHGDGIKTSTGEVLGLEFVGATISAEITGLSSYKHYFYRVVANNASTENPSNADKGLPVVGAIEELTTRSLASPSTGEAGNITRTSATLSGTVLAPFVQTTYYFEYISETAFQKALENGAANPASPNYKEELAKGAPSPYAEGESTVPVTIEGSEATQAAGPVPASGLLPGTTYHYRLVAKNKFGWEYGQDQTFTTLPSTPPIVSTGGVSGVTQTGATISGTVDTNSLQTQYGFEISAEPFQPGTHVPATGLGSIGGEQTNTVTLTLGELQPGTTYYYRVTATNADGTVASEPAGSFTTVGIPDLFTAPPTVPSYNGYEVPLPKEVGTTGAGTTTKQLTNKQKLAKALKTCEKDKSKGKRAKCEAAARKKYPTASKKKGKGKKK